jgi:glucose-1-phosphate adenylyltransferase
MSNSRVCKKCIRNRSIISDQVIIGEKARLGEGADVPNEYKPGIYNSGITVVGEEASIPADAVIGKNVMMI